MFNEKNFFDLLSSRHSVRAFKDVLIAEDKINAITDAATRGPSAGNLQSYQILIVSNMTEKNWLNPSMAKSISAKLQ